MLTTAVLDVGQVLVDQPARWTVRAQHLGTSGHRLSSLAELPALLHDLRSRN